MDYTASLRQAHITALRQKYIDIMEDARLEKEQKQLAYDDAMQAAYVEQMTGIRDMPQQLRAYGFGGGMQENELGEVYMQYQDQIENLKKNREQFISEYNRIIEVQTRLRDNAIAEYNAKCALEDAKAAEAAAAAAAAAAAKNAKSSSGSSKSSTKSTTSSGVPQVTGGKVSTGGLYTSAVSNVVAAAQAQLKKK